MTPWFKVILESHLGPRVDIELNLSSLVNCSLILNLAETCNIVGSSDNLFEV